MSEHQPSSNKRFVIGAVLVSAVLLMLTGAFLRSSKVFHSPQSGQQPSQRAVSYPQDAQT